MTVIKTPEDRLKFLLGSVIFEREVLSHVVEVQRFELETLKQTKGVGRKKPERPR